MDLIESWTLRKRFEARIFINELFGAKPEQKISIEEMLMLTGVTPKGGVWQ